MPALLASSAFAIGNMWFFGVLIEYVLGTTDFSSCDSSSSLILSLRCDATLDGDDTSFWSSDSRKDPSSAWLLFSYNTTKEIGSYMIQACGVGAAGTRDSCASQQAPSYWRVLMGQTLTSMQYVEERVVSDWMSKERRTFTLSQSVKTNHIKLVFLAVEFPIPDTKPTFSIAEFNAYPPVVFTYFTGPWSDCSEPCDGGTQTRAVACWGNDGRRDYTLDQCAFSLGIPPALSQSCNNNPCLIPEIAEITAEPAPERTDELIVQLVPNAGTEVKCLATSSNRTTTPTFEEVNTCPNLPSNCAPPSCSLSLDGLLGNSPYMVYCVIYNSGEEFSGGSTSVVATSDYVWTSASNATDVKIISFTETSASVLATLQDAVIVGIDISCSAVQLAYDIPDQSTGTTSYLSSNTPGSTLALKAMVNTTLANCITKSCSLTFENSLSSGARYEVKCFTKGGLVTTSPIFSTSTASIQTMQYLYVTSKPTAVIRLGLSSPGHVSCSLTPVALLVCCPNAPQYVEFAGLPIKPCSLDCELTFSGMANATRYVTWCASVPFTRTSFSLFPQDDFGIRFDTPKTVVVVTSTTETPKSTIGPIRLTTTPAPKLAGSATKNSILVSVVFILTCLFLVCLCSSLGRRICGLSPEGHAGHPNAPAPFKMVFLEISSTCVWVTLIPVLTAVKNESLFSISSRVIAITGSFSLCLSIWVVVVQGLVQLLIARTKRGADNIDCQVLAKLYIPPVSFYVPFTASDHELEHAWKTKRFFARLDTFIGLVPLLITLITRAFENVGEIVLVSVIPLKLIAVLMTYTEGYHLVKWDAWGDKWTTTIEPMEEAVEN